MAAGAVFAACRPPIVQAACDGTIVSSSPATFTDPQLVEVSGIAESAQNPGTYWVNNDSGDTARVFAVASSGATRVTYTFTGASAIDWEDLALGRGPVANQPYLYAADTGDNGRSRGTIAIYRVREPVVSGSGTQALAGVDRINLRYPDGAKDAEAFLVDPWSGQLYVIEKSGSGGPVGIYRAPADLVAGSTTTMARAGTLNLPSGLDNQVTGADVALDGRSIAVRTYGGVRLWSRDDGQSIEGALGAGECRGPIPVEDQGESVGFSPDGRAYNTMSEGTRPVLHRFTAPSN